MNPKSEADLMMTELGYEYRKIGDTYLYKKYWKESKCEELIKVETLTGEVYLEYSMRVLPSLDRRTIKALDKKFTELGL